MTGNPHEMTKQNDAIPGVERWERGKYFFLGYDSLDTFITWISAPRGRWHNTSNTIGNSAWFGTTRFDEALDMLRHGWPEGCKKMLDKVQSLVPPARPSLVPFLAHDVAGAYPDVPAFCAGQPDYMITRQQIEAGASPVVTIHANASASCHVKAEQIERYGAAVLTHVRDLEAAGYSTRLVVDWTTSGRGIDCVHTCVPIKEAGAPLDIDRAAFMLVHPSMLRRCFFRSLEYDIRQRPLSHGYGSPCFVPTAQRVPGEVYLSTIKQLGKDKDAMEYYERLSKDIIRDRPDLAMQDAA